MEHRSRKNFLVGPPRLTRWWLTSRLRAFSKREVQRHQAQARARAPHEDDDRYSDYDARRTLTIPSGRCCPTVSRALL